MKGKPIQNFIASLVLISLLFTVFSSAWAESQSANQQFGVISLPETGRVNLYSQASAKSPKISTYTSRQWFALMEDRAGWLKVQMNDGNIGYIVKSQTEIASVAPTFSGVVDNPEGTKLLNLRARPDRTSPVVAQYESGIPCTILSRTGDWFHVQVNGLDGYFHKDYLATYMQPVSSSLATITGNGTGNVAIFADPGMTGVQKGMCMSGDVVMLLNFGAEYSEISTKGTWGFVASDKISMGIVPVESNQSELNVASISSLSCKIYAAASDTSMIMEVLPQGRSIIVESRGTEWCQVKTSAGNTGYAQTENLLFSGKEVPIRKVTHPDKTFVNLRTAPSLTNGRVIERVSHGENVIILAPGIVWSRVSYKNTVGYMMTVYLQ